MASQQKDRYTWPGNNKEGVGHGKPVKGQAHMAWK